MTAASAPRASNAPAESRGARIAIISGAVALALALNAVAAAIAVAAGAPATWAPLSFPVFAAFTVVPMVIGWFAWQFVSRRVSNPARTMPLLAVGVLALSLIPDAILLATGFIPGTTMAGVFGLMAMHVIVIGVASVGYTLAAKR